MINPHYFGENIVRPFKNAIVNFVFVGGRHALRREYQFLIDAVKELAERKIDFSITLVGTTTLQIPEELQKYFICEGALNAKEVYKKIMNADFYLMLLDPENEKHNIYATSSSTGSAQLVYGFKKVPIIHRKFAQHYDFDDTNAIIYDGRKLADAMYEAILMSTEKYIEKQTNLERLAKEIYQESLSNLRDMISITEKE
ncbi:MAG: hypothetical protein LBB29_02340 [Holosporaceae bacterium]|jgi:hypothetical protein|nr:hypothetical protein [Holosporaceae bacterium]